jgi:hypothetical protein
LHEFIRQSEKVLSLMPYPKQYERSSFVLPSSNSVNIITCCGSAIRDSKTSPFQTRSPPSRSMFFFLSRTAAAAH